MTVAAVCLMVCGLALVGALTARSRGAEPRLAAWAILAGLAGAVGVYAFVIGALWGV